MKKTNKKKEENHADYPEHMLNYVVAADEKMNNKT